MTYKHHTRLELVEGGNIFKQGDHPTLKFIAYDSLGNEVDLTGKEVEGALYSRNKGIMYEAPASFTDDRIVFTINELLDNGDFQLEFTVTDSADPDYRAKFPSDEYAAKLTIKPSKDNMDFVGVSMTTVAQLKTELQGLQTEFAGQVLPRVDIVEDKQTQLEADYQAAAGALTEDSEVILARKGEPTLRAFNDKVVAQLAEKPNKDEVAKKYEFSDFRNATGATLAAMQAYINGGWEGIEQLFTGYVAGTLSNMNGSLNPSTSLSTSADFIEISPEKQYIFGARDFGTNPTAVVKIARYDENRNFISITDFINFAPNTHQPVPIIENARFIKATVSNYAADSYFINEGTVPFFQLEEGGSFWDSVPSPPLKEKSVQLNHLSEDTTRRVEEWRDLTKVEYVENLNKGFVPGTLSNANGNVSASSTISTSSDFIPVDLSKPFIFGAKDYANGTNAAIKIARYGSAKNFLSITDFEPLPPQTHKSLPMVQDTAFVKVSINNFAKDAFFLNVGTTPFREGIPRIYDTGFSKLMPSGIIERKHLSEVLLSELKSVPDASELPFPKKLRFEKVVTSQPIKITHLSRDGKIIYATRGNRLVQSINEGDNWSDVLESPNGRAVLAIRDTDDGELLYTTQRDHTNDVKSAIFKTSGYKRDLNGAISSTKVLDALGIFADFNDAWGLEIHDSIAVATEYGLQGDDGARNAFVSIDYGNTWTHIFDQKITTQGITGAPVHNQNAHLHTIHYDRYRERIWLAAGDSTNCATYYSDDLGQSWKVAKESTGLGAIQYTGIVSYPEGVFFGSDRAPDGIYLWKETENKSDDVFIEPYFLTERADFRTLVYGRPFRRYAEKNEITYFAAMRDMVVDGQMGPLIVGLKSTYGAAVLFDFTSDLNYKDITSCVGTTANGNILVSIRDVSTNSFDTLRAKAPVWE